MCCIKYPIPKQKHTDLDFSFATKKQKNTLLHYRRYHFNSIYLKNVTVPRHRKVIVLIIEHFLFPFIHI